jgi:4-alpha-glucanotransferase
MKVGLYLDVAVGVQADGFDAWNEQAAISRHLGVGAPPDPLNTAGQTGASPASMPPGWSYSLRAVSRHAARLDAARRRHQLDHVLGLKRLYLVPNGFSAVDGVYVQMPFEALLAVTAQESSPIAAS